MPRCHAAVPQLWTSSLLNRLAVRRREQDGSTRSAVVMRTPGTSSCIHRWLGSQLRGPQRKGATDGLFSAVTGGSKAENTSCAEETMARGRMEALARIACSRTSAQSRPRILGTEQSHPSGGVCAGVVCVQAWCAIVKWGMESGGRCASVGRARPIGNRAYRVAEKQART